MGEARAWKRKIYLINKPLQLSYMGITIWVLLLGMVLVGTLIYYVTLNTFLNQMKTAGNMLLALELVDEVNRILLRSAGVVFVCLIVLAGALKIIFLHRIAGPMHRIEKVIQELSRGKKVAQIELRKKDSFKNVAEAINKLIGFHNERDEKVQAILKEAKKLPELKEKVAQVEPLFPDFSQET